MLRYVARRLLLMIPTFVGITLLTFALMSIGDDPLAPETSGEVPLGDRVLSHDERHRLRAVLGYDLPPLVNVDVEDARRTVQAAAERVVETWARVAPRLRMSVYEAGVGDGLREVEAAGLMDRVSRHARQQLERGRESDDGLFAVSGPGARAGRIAAAPFAAALRRAIGDMDRLRRLGGQTARWLRPVIEDVGDEDKLLADVVGGEDGLEQAEGFSAAAMRDSVAAWLAAARAEVDARAGGADPRAHEPARVTAEEALRRYGGFMMGELMPRLLDQSPHVKAFASDLIYGYGGCDVRFTAFGSPGRPLNDGEVRLQAVQEDRLARWWRRNALRYREVSALERWGWLSWTHTRYARWVKNLVTLDFGESFEQSRSVRDLVAERLPVTLLLQGSAILLMYLFAVPLAMWTAAKKGTAVDRVVASVMFVLLSAPSFWVATMCVLGFGGVFPMDGIRSPDVASAILDGSLSIWSWRALIDLAWHCILPVAVLSYGGIAVLQRFARSSVLEALSQPWVRAARARGLPEPQVLRRHVLRPALTPLVTLLAVLLPTMVGGSVIVERIFAIEGMGLLAWDGVMRNDVPVVMAVVTLSAVVTMVGYLLADLLYAWIDPRVRHG
ncbi:MAG: ABC transporter permease subunit [Planctomycetota bacterium]|nr:ABC transporter permease subunit [Planctomycetota bacterium]